MNRQGTSVEISKPAMVQPRAANAASLNYVLITPARNEALLIEQTIQAVIAQTRQPLKWVIVSDGSDDGTDEIVTAYAEKYSWIELVRMPKRTERHFAGKVHAFNAGYDRVKGLDYDVIVNLDADITFDNEYFAFLMKKFASDSTLGVAGTPFNEEGAQYDYRFTSIEHVSGACQLFRRECFEQIGGFVPIKIGGVDLVAVTTARMKGWQTRTFLDKVCLHHRKYGKAQGSPIAMAFKEGRGDYTHGCDPLWQIFRCIYQMSHPPIILRGISLYLGFLWAMVTRSERPVSREFTQFRKFEQRRRLAAFIRSVLPGPR